MKVKELIETLKNFDPELVVILSGDGEGNNFSPMDDISDNSIYVPDTDYSGSIYLEKLDDELEKMGYSDEDVYHGKKGKRAIVFYPTN
jgi:hypothetical protein